MRSGPLAGYGTTAAGSPVSLSDVPETIWSGICNGDDKMSTARLISAILIGPKPRVRFRATSGSSWIRRQWSDDVSLNDRYRLIVLKNSELRRGRMSAI